MVSFIPHFGPFGLNIYWLGCIGSLSSESHWWCTNISKLPLDVKCLNQLHLPFFIIQLQVYSTWLYSVLVISLHNWVLVYIAPPQCGLGCHSTVATVTPSSSLFSILSSATKHRNICDGLQCGFSQSSHLIATVTVQISGHFWRWVFNNRLDSSVARHTHDTWNLTRGDTKKVPSTRY